MSRVSASPYFFRPVKRALLAGLATLCVLAIVFPAPLELAANPSRPPNPAKSAWFLLSIQELVSYDTSAIWVALVLAVLLIALPWMPVGQIQNASWFQKQHRALAALVVLAFVAIVGLTIVGLFFRGADWQFVTPY